MHHEHAYGANGCEHADDGEHHHEGSPYQRFPRVPPLILAGELGTNPRIRAQRAPSLPSLFAPNRIWLMLLPILGHRAHSIIVRAHALHHQPHR